MKKRITFVFVMLCTLALIGCGCNTKKTTVAHIDGNVTAIDVTLHLEWGKREWSFMGEGEINGIREWLDNLECEPYEVGDEKSPRQKEGIRIYDYVVKGENYSVFSYVICGPEECYLLYEGDWYSVLNPSEPRISFPLVD